MNYFSAPTCITHKKYEALRAFFYERLPAEEVAKRFGYKLSAFYSLTRDFREFIKDRGSEDMFFITKKPGRKYKDKEGSIVEGYKYIREVYL